MKIAIPTNDRKTIAERTGRCKEFVIANIENKQVTYSYVANHHEHHDHEAGEHHDHSHSEIVEALAGIDFMLLIKIGKHLKQDLENGKIAFKKTQETDIESAINSYLSV